jgi:hypothetical protein
MSAEIPREPRPTRAELTKGDTAPQRTAGSTAGSPGGGTGGGTAKQRAPMRRPRGNRRLAYIAGAVVVAILAIVILVIALGGGDGTKAMANPIEVRQLVATFQCNPNSPSSIKVTAGQEIVQLGRGGCAVVGPVLENGTAKVDRATKIVSKSAGSGCTVTIQSTAKYGAIVDKASVVDNGYARALVGGGYVLELRALLYTPAKSVKLSVVFQANDQGACDKVANALRRT